MPSPPYVYPLTASSPACLVSHEPVLMPARPPPSQCGDWPMLKHFHPSYVPCPRPIKPFIGALLVAALLLSSYSKTVGGGFACGIEAATRVEMRLKSGYLWTGA